MAACGASTLTGSVLAQVPPPPPSAPPGYKAVLPAPDAPAEKTQVPPAAPSPPVPRSDPLVLTQFAWLDGCWRGEVNQREYREHWLPLRGGLMLGASHTVTDGKTQSYEYLRLEPRADGIYYINIAMTPRIEETTYKLVERKMDREDEIFTFSNSAQTFPQRISYRHNSAGWLYATIEGELGGTAKSIIYPMHRIDCETGEGIKK